MKEITNDRDIVVLSDRDHLLTRPNTWIGSVEPSEKEEWILKEDGTISRQKITYTEGLLKIINEVIDNVLDEYSKTNGRFANKLSIKTENGKITVTDNGRGLPIKKTDEGEWMPEAAFCKLKAGSNFGKNRTSIGTNGIGASATNVFSTYFEVVTSDGEKKFKLHCENNLSSSKYSLLANLTGETGTRVSFIPDYKRFGVDNLPPEIETLLKTRLRMLSWFFPKCVIKYNGETIGLRAKDFANMFPQPSVSFSNENVYILIYPTEEAESLTYVNGLSLRRGGTHVDYIINTIVGDIREKVSRKYKSIKPTDIKNRLGSVILFKNFPNCQFDSQTKEAITNNERDIKSYLSDVDLSAKLSNKILKEKEIIDNITDIFKLKEDLKEKKELAKLNAKKREITSDKYFPPIGDKKYLVITEGQSAFGGISPVLGRRNISYYQIKGKIFNCQDTTIKRAMENQEINDLVNILGIDVTNPDSNMSFEKVVIASDEDSDGVAISALITGLFSKICPRIVKEGRLCRLHTPLVIGVKKVKNSLAVDDYFFTIPDKKEMSKPGVEYRYVKGLGSYGGRGAELLKQVIEREGGIEGLMMPIVSDTHSKENLERWLGDSSEYRKKALRGKEFHIDKA